jgi:NAD(P)-dependent dehydrogenase (short-subunit alcohol dehydrogenase family)
MKPVALVTGAARGIGHGTAERLGAEGFDLVVCDVREPGEAAGAMKALEATGAAVLYVKCDISSRDDRARLVDETRARFGRLNALVNNAGVAPKLRADILEATEESYDFVMGINLRGPYFLTQLVANWMVAQKADDAGFRGCVVNISSISSTVASPSRGEYCLSKAGVSMMTALYAVRLAEYDIPVYEIRPGIIQTDMTAVVKEKYDALIAEGLTLQKRWGQPADIGRAVAALARGDLAYSTGQVIMVDGGLTVGRL